MYIYICIEREREREREIPRSRRVHMQAFGMYFLVWV